MSQVSKRYLSQKTQERIFSLFITGLLYSDSKDLTASLVEDLFTPTERVMLAKRFSIAYMLLEGYDYDSIAHILKVSKSTIGNVSLWLKEKGAGFRKVIEKIKRHEAAKKVLDDIKDAFEDFIASVPGQNWSESKSTLWHSRRERQKPY